MMVIKNLSSEVDLALGRSQHSLVVGLLDGGSVVLSIDARTYGQLVGAFEQLHVQARQTPAVTRLPYLEPAPMVEDVRQQVEQHLGHQLAPGPVPKEEIDAAAQLSQLEAQHAPKNDWARDVLESVGFFPDTEGTPELDAFAMSGAEGDEPDSGELSPSEDGEDGIEAY